MNKEVAIYGERCPEGLLRYIGKSKNPRRRREEHLFDVRRGKKSHHFNWLKTLSKPPELELLARAPADAWEDVERYWIALARDYGCKLTNQTDGGEAGPSPLGRKTSSETRLKLSASMSGRKLSAETREKISIAQRGIIRSPESVANRAAGLRGYKHTEAARANFSAAAKKRGNHDATNKPPRLDNTTGFKGVSPSKSGFEARIWRSGRTIYLGEFPTREEAARARDFGVLQHYPIGSFLNFPFIPETE